MKQSPKAKPENQNGSMLWPDNMTRDLLTRSTLNRYIDELSVAGLTSNRTICDDAIKNITRLRRCDPRGPCIQVDETPIKYLDPVHADQQVQLPPGTNLF